MSGEFTSVFSLVSETEFSFVSLMSTLFLRKTFEPDSIYMTVRQVVLEWCLFPSDLSC